jgi:hypothetical protein
MGIFYKASDKELLEIRKKIFVDHGLPALTKNGFVKSPFSTAWFGKDDIGGYTYDLCRLTNDNQLETLTVYIVRGDKWIKVYLNIFALEPPLESVSRLEGMDGLQFLLPPNSRTKMRLRSDDISGIPLFSYNFWFRRHTIRSYYSRAGLTRRANRLARLLEADLGNIDRFVGRWHALHRPIVTSWEGFIVENL